MTLRRQEVYLRLAKNTAESIKEAVYDCPRDMQGIVFRAAAQSKNLTQETMAYMIGQTSFGFVRLEENRRTGKMERISCSPVSNEYNCADVDNFRPEAISRLKTFVQSPAIKGNEITALELLFKIGKNVPGNTKDVCDAFAAAVNSEHATDTTLIYAVYRLNFLLFDIKIKEDDNEKHSAEVKKAVCENFADEALDVFTAVANPKNNSKLNEEALNDFYNAIKPFGEYNPKLVKYLVEKMQKLETAKRVVDPFEINPKIKSVKGVGTSL